MLISNCLLAFVIKRFIMDNNVEIVQKQIDALNELKKEYGEDVVNQLYDELDKLHQFVDLGYGVMIVGNTLAIHYISRCVNCGLIKKDTLSCRD